MPNHKEPELDFLEKMGELPSIDKLLEPEAEEVPRDKLGIVYRSISELTPNEKNCRKHPAFQLNRLCKSIQQFGFVQPIIIDENNTVLCGHGRLRAAQLLNLELIPTIKISYLTDNQKKAFLIADNHINEMGGWDDDLLREALEELKKAPDIDLDALAFTDNQLDSILGPMPENTMDELPDYKIIPGLENARDMDAYRKAIAKIDRLEGTSDYVKEFAKLAAAKLIEYDIYKLQKAVANIKEPGVDNAMAYAGLWEKLPEFVKSRAYSEKSRLAKKRQKNREKYKKFAEDVAKKMKEDIFFR